jgi:hypothetical protein
VANEPKTKTFADAARRLVRMNKRPNVEKNGGLTATGRRIANLFRRRWKNDEKHAGGGVPATGNLAAAIAGVQVGRSGATTLRHIINCDMTARNLNWNLYPTFPPHVETPSRLSRNHQIICRLKLKGQIVHITSCDTINT